MADADRKILLEVNIDNSDAVKHIAEVQSEIVRLKSAQKALDRTTDEGREAYARYDLQIRTLQRDLNAYSREVQNEINLQRTEADSIDGLKLRLTKLQNEYKKLTAAERESAEGKELLRRIEELRGEYEEAGGSISVFSKLLQKLTGIQSAASGVFGKFGALLAGGAVAGALGKLGAALGKTFTEIQATGDAWEEMTTGMSAGWEYFKRSLITSDWSNFMTNIKAAIKAGREYAQVMDELEDRNNAFAIAEADAGVEISALDNQLKNVNLSNEERIKIAQQIIDKETELAQKRQELAQADYDATLKNIAAKTGLHEKQVEWYVKEFENNKDLVKQAEEYNKAVDLVKLGDNSGTGLFGMVKQENYDNAKKVIAGATDELKKFAVLQKGLGDTTGEELKLITEKYVGLRGVIKQLNETLSGTSKRLQALIKGEATEAEKNEKKTTSDYKQEQSKRLDIAEKTAAAELQLNKVKAQSELDLNKASATEIFNHKQEYEQKEFALQQKYTLERAKLEGKNVAAIQKQQDAELKVFNEGQTQAAVKFTKDRTKEIGKLMKADVKQDIADLKAEYANAEKDAHAAIDKDQTKTDEQKKGDKNIVTEKLTEEREARITAINEAAAQTRIAVINKEFEDVFALHQDNASKTLEAEHDRISQVILTRKQLGLDTIKEEAALRKVEQSMTDADTAAALLKVRDSAKKTYEVKKAALEKELQAAEGNADLQAQIRAEQADLDRDYWLDRIDNIAQYTGAAQQLLGSLNEVFANASAERIQQAEDDASREKETIDSRVAAGVITEKEGAKKKEEIDKKLEQTKASEARKAAIREKAMAVFDIAINTAVGVSKALASLNFAMAAIVGGLGALQLAAVMSKPIPKAARGRLIKGRRHGSGGETIEAEAGEMIINRRSSSMFAPLLSAINQAGGGVPFGVPPDGGFALREHQRQSGGESINYTSIGESVAEAMKKTKIYTAIEDINKGERKFVNVTDTGLYNN